jgi:high affinity choline transporter 7
MSPVLAAAAIGCFYAAFLAVGIWAGRAGKEARTSDGLLLANRRLPLIVGIMTMTATWVGGGYIVGTAEAVFDPTLGLLWAQAPWCYALSLIIGGLFFARRMRRQRFTTLLDLFERRYGQRTAAVLYLPALCGELFWAAAILAALGTTLSTILQLPVTLSIILSAAVVVLYTVFGGLWSVAYTDVLQLVCIMVGLCAAVWFASGAVSNASLMWSNYTSSYGANANWLPTIDAIASRQPWVLQWLDSALLLALGGIPWQVYFQRVLASKSENQAMMLSIIGGIGCLVMAIPAVAIGVIGANTDWSQTAAGQPPEAALVLPYVLRYLTPSSIALLGLASIAAAVMSSVDSSLLSAASMFAWNVYRPLLNRTASPAAVRRVVRAAIIALGIAATCLAVQVQSVYALWYLCADLVYVVLFPQLVLGLYCRRMNAVGALTGSAVALFLRVGGGEPLIDLPPLLNYPLNDPDAGVQFPFRTSAMLVGLTTAVVVSRCTLRWFPARDCDAGRGIDSDT